MAPRPYWKGYLKLSLVSCPIALYTATSGGERVSFRQINKKTGNRLRQQLVDEVTREPVEAADKGRGYEVDKDTYILVEDEEIEAVAIESNHTIEIDRFVPLRRSTSAISTGPITSAERRGRPGSLRGDPRGDARQGHGRARPHRAGEARARHHAAAVGQGLLGTTLRYAYEVRTAAEYFDEIADMKVAREMLQLAEHILETKEADFDPATFVDQYEKAVVKCCRRSRPASRCRPGSRPARRATSST